MLNVGSHNYYYHTQDGVTLLLTLSDCEYVESRRFINSTSDTIFQMLTRSIFQTIWAPNRYDIQNLVGMDFLFGREQTQQFIEHVSTDSDFFGLLPMDLLCVASVGLYPYHDLNARIEIELAFGPARDYHINNNPNSHQRHL